ncbi:C-terminal binding protein [Salinisphaera sp. LB1]|uniref:C-terminal binding protein n=1 Tax=Salinisphaera sp. LB1 TaxID=2183911 RepID=UPI000D70660F|nr:C-terminal binding protein [Salinisphaera sp. LB1]AWN15382.1 D-3-phosphoglycerate dehydrogenase [Salinisphaera sp. LB1]
MSRTFRILTPDAQYDDDAELERETAGPDFAFDIFRERDAARVDEQYWRAADALLVWHEVFIDRELIAKLDNCRVIVRAGVGFDHIDLDAAAAAGIPVCNTPDYGTSEVADHAIGMLLAFRRGLVFHDQRLQRAPVDAFKPGAPQVERVRGSRLGIVGLGRIGTATALRAKAFGIEVVAYDPELPRGQEIAVGVSRVDSLAELLQSCDAVTLHTPLNEQTHHLIDAEALARMPKHAVLINTARGAVIDIDALYDALIEGRIAGAALDVLPEEPPDMNRPLFTAIERGDERLKDRLILTPHAAWYSPASRADARRLSTETLTRYLRGEGLRNCVNAGLVKQYGHG